MVSHDRHPEHESKRVAGSFDSAENILHLRFPEEVTLADVPTMRAFFREVIDDWIAPRRQSPYLLIDYANLHIPVSVAEEYAAQIMAFQSKVLGTFRYNVPADFTGVTVTVANMRIAKRANVFLDEATARAAIRAAKDEKTAPRGPSDKWGSRPVDTTTRKTSEYRIVRARPKPKS